MGVRAGTSGRLRWLRQATTWRTKHAALLRWLRHATEGAISLVHFVHWRDMAEKGGFFVLLVSPPAPQVRIPRWAQCRTVTRRKGDSNPRYSVTRILDFESSAFNHSAISPKKTLYKNYYSAGPGRKPFLELPVRQRRRAQRQSTANEGGLSLALSR